MGYFLIFDCKLHLQKTLLPENACLLIQASFCMNKQRLEAMFTKSRHIFLQIIAKAYGFITVN